MRRLQLDVALLLHHGVADNVVCQDGRLVLRGRLHDCRGERGRHRSGRIVGGIEFVRLLNDLLRFLGWFVLFIECVQDGPRFGANHPQCVLGVGLESLLFGIHNLEVVLEVMKARNVEFFQVSGVLQGNDVLPRERFVRQQVLEVLGAQIELIDGFVREHVARRFDGDDVRVFGEHLVEDRTVVLAFRVLDEVEAYQFLGFDGLSGGRIDTVLFDERHDVHNVVYDAFGGA
uniref:Uncharacterized protein n=1 Tax=Ixodes ricinus TaxID=34613 RepID=A0A6B0V688_IXORI